MQSGAGPVCGPVSVPRGSGAGPEIPPYPHVLRTGWGPAPDFRKAVRSASGELIEGNDPERQALARLFHLWRLVYGDATVRVTDFARLPVQRLAPSKHAEARELFDLVCELTGTGGRDLFDPKRLGNYLYKREGRQSCRLRLVKGRDARSKVATWRLEEREVR